MRSLSVVLSILLFTSLTMGVVGGPEAGKGEMVIMDSSSSSATKSVDNDGTDWRSSIENIGASCISANQTSDFSTGNFSENGSFTELEFSGSLETSNPCHRAELNVSETSENKYKVEILEKGEMGPCVQCLGILRFKGSFAAEGDYQVTFVHEGEELAVRETEGFDSIKIEEPEDESVYKAIFSWFKWLDSLF